MRAVSGPRVIVVGAGVYGLAAARRLAAAGAAVTVFEAREAGGSFAASAGSTRVLRFEYGALAHYTELVLRAREAWRELERELGESLYRETGMLWFAIELSQYLDDSLRATVAAGLPARLLEPSEAARLFPAFSVEGVAAVLHNEAGGVLEARRATARPRAPRAGGRRGPARGGRRARRRRRRRRAGRRQQRAGRPGARRHGRLDERAAGRAHPLDAAGQRLPARAHCRPADLDLRLRRLRARRRRRRRPQGRRPRDRRRRRPRRSRGARGSGRGGAAARRRRAPAPAGPGLAGRRGAPARRGRVLLRADADRDGDRRPHRRAHGDLRRLLGPRLQVRADRGGGRRRPRARAGAGNRPRAVPPARLAQA